MKIWIREETFIIINSIIKLQSLAMQLMCNGKKWVLLGTVKGIYFKDNE